jgi:hypothetical protein
MVVLYCEVTIGYNPRRGGGHRAAAYRDGDGNETPMGEFGAAGPARPPFAVYLAETGAQQGLQQGLRAADRARPADALGLLASHLLDPARQPPARPADATGRARRPVSSYLTYSDKHLGGPLQDALGWLARERPAAPSAELAQLLIDVASDVDLGPPPHLYGHH